MNLVLVTKALATMIVAGSRVYIFLGCFLNRLKSASHCAENTSVCSLYSQPSGQDMLLSKGHLLGPPSSSPLSSSLLRNSYYKCFYYAGNFSGFVLLWLKGVSLFQLLIAYSTKRISGQIKDHAKTFYLYKYICQKTTSRNQLQSHQ